MSESTPEFYILDVQSARRSDQLLWWKPDDHGYTTCLDDAGRYSAVQVFEKGSYYNNETDTLAVPCELANKLSVRVVPGGGTLLSRLKLAAREMLLSPQTISE